MSHAKPSLADALLDAHVHFLLDQLTGDGLIDWIESGLDELLAQAKKLRLDDCVTRKMIKDTAHAFASDMEPGGGIPELVGDAARALYAHPAHERTTFGELLSDRQFAEVVDKALELKSLHKKLVHELVASPLYAHFASDLLYHGIKGYLAHSPLTRGIPGAGSVMKLGKSVMSKATPRLEATIEESLKKYIGKTVKSTAHSSASLLLSRADTALMREMALEFWQRIKPLPVAALRADISALDVEEAFVTLYEYWRSLRKTAYYKQLIDAGIDTVFDKYGDATLAELLADLGITREMMLGEARRFAPHVLKALNRKHLLEPALRRNLQRFYDSPAARKILPAV